MPRVLVGWRTEGTQFHKKKRNNLAAQTHSKNLTMIFSLRWANSVCLARLFKGMVVLE